MVCKREQFIKSGLFAGFGYLVSILSFSEFPTQFQSTGFNPLVYYQLDIYAYIKLVGKTSCHNLSLCGALKIRFLSRVSCLNCLHHKLLTGVIRIRNS